MKPIIKIEKWFLNIIIFYIVMRSRLISSLGFAEVYDWNVISINGYVQISIKEMIEKKKIMMFENKTILTIE